MKSQKPQEEKRDRLASDPAGPTQMPPESGRRRANSDRMPGKLEDVQPQQRQDPTTSQNKGDIKHEKDGCEGEVHILDSKSIPPEHTNEIAERMQQRDMKKSDSSPEKYIEGELTDHHRSESVVEEKATTSWSVQPKEQEKDRDQGDIPSSDSQILKRDKKKGDIRQEKYRDREQAGDHHRSDSESLIHGHLNSNVEEEATTSQYEQAKEQGKDRSQGEGHKLDSKPIPPKRTDKVTEWLQQRDMETTDIRQEKYREQADHHRSDSESVVHGHLNPNVEEEATTSEYERAKKQGKDRHQGDVHRLLSKLFSPGRTNENAELMQQPEKKKSDIRQEKKRDRERAGDRCRSDSDSVVHGHMNPNVEKEATTNQSVQAKKQEKDRRQGEVHRLDSKSILPGHTNENAEKSDIRQEYYRDGERVGDYHRSDSKSLVEDEATTNWSVQVKEQKKDRDQGDVPSSDSKLDLNEHIYDEVKDYHRPEFDTVSPKPPQENVSAGEQRPQAATEKKNRKIKGDKERFNLILVLLGQSGSGKSASGNTILGKEVFESYLSSVPVTTQCKKVETQMFGIHLTVIDTPDFFGEDLKERDKALEDCKSLIKATTNHKYLLVMQLGRFTDGEREILPQIKAMFGEEVVQNVIILFTHAKELNGKTLEEYTDQTDSNLQDVIKECGSRVCAFENTVKNPKQVSGLFDIICEMEGITRKKAEKKECSIS